MQKAAADGSQQNKELQDALDALEAKSNEVNELKIEIEKTADISKSQSNVLENERQIHREELEKLRMQYKKDMKEQDARQSNVENQSLKTREEIERLSAANKSLTVEVEDAKVKLIEKDDSIRVLEDEINSLKATLKELNTQTPTKEKPVIVEKVVEKIVEVPSSSRTTSKPTTKTDSKEHRDIDVQTDRYIPEGTNEQQMKLGASPPPLQQNPKKT